MARAKELLFVYGTLRRGALRGGQRNPFAIRLEQEAGWLGEAKVRGRLYQVNPEYPGLAKAKSAEEWVSGEVWELGDAELWQTLDDYEGAEYVRVLWTVTTADGRKRDAWVYVYASRITMAMAIVAV